MAPLCTSCPGKSGIAPLQDGRDAFAARALLADSAERTLDVQYYMWHADTTGTLLFESLRRAADRGVKVRLLLDDSNTAGLDPILAALDSHPDIEVRLFNPFFFRKWRILDVITDFGRVNRRMHNKSFTADGQVTIVGGRNVGDEYFGAGRDTLFVDLDVLAVGPVVEEVTADFERYWASESAHRLARLLPARSEGSHAEVAAAAAKIQQGPEAATYLEALETCGFVKDLLSGGIKFEWADAVMVSDDPSKALDRARKHELMWTKLQSKVAVPKERLELISAYFVPGADGVAFFSQLAKSGVAVTVLTNAVEATDVTAVHAGYAKRRKPLLRAGVKLFEMKAQQALPRGRRRLVRHTGSSRSSLHAKTFSVDGERVFVGSFNFDPRSARLNTEMGFVINSKALAAGISQVFLERIPGRAYQVEVGKTGALQWSEHVEGKQVTHHREPGTGPWLRLGVWLMARLPVEWLL